MEPFIDGGLFELLVVSGFAMLLNFIFLKRYLLIIFSVLMIAGPVLLYFIHKNELYNWIVTLCLFNAVLLVTIMWKQKKEKPADPLFNLEGMKNKLSEFRNKIAGLFVRKAGTEKDKINA